VFTLPTVQQQSSKRGGNEDFFEGTLDALGKGLSYLSTSAYYVGEKLSENVIEPTRAAVADPNFTYNMTSYLSGIGEKVCPLPSPRFCPSSHFFSSPRSQRERRNLTIMSAQAAMVLEVLVMVMEVEVEAVDMVVAADTVVATLLLALGTAPVVHHRPAGRALPPPDPLLRPLSPSQRPTGTMTGMSPGVVHQIPRRPLALLRPKRPPRPPREVLPSPRLVATALLPEVATEPFLGADMGPRASHPALVVVSSSP